MARRNRETSSPANDPSRAVAVEDPTTEEAVVTAPTTDAPVEEATPEAPAADATTEPATEAASPAKEKKEIDLTAFREAVDTAVAQRDESTGDLAVAQIEPVVAAYRALDGIAAKNKGKGLLTDLMREAMNEMDIQLARSYMVLQDNLSAGAGGGGGATRAPVDPTEAYVERRTGLMLALALIDRVKDDKVADDADTQAEQLYGNQFNTAESYLAWSQQPEESRGDEPVDVPGFVKAAVKLAQGKSAKVGGRQGGGGSASGERHDIGEHIRQAFESVESGQFLTVAEIRKHKSTEYGDNPPSAGAISARLFPNSGKCTLDFVTPGQNDKGNRGATKN